MGTQITRLTRLAAAGLSAVLLFATTACAATSPAETEPDNKTSVPAPTGPINVVASLNQWGSLAAELGGTLLSGPAPGLELLAIERIQAHGLPQILVAAGRAHAEIGASGSEAVEATESVDA